MKTDLCPVAWFLREEDARKVRGALVQAGISSTVRKCKNPPEGWTIAETEGFNVWVRQTLMEKARVVYRETMRNSTALVCAKCRKNVPTIHVTTVLPDGRRSTEHLCQDCSPAD